MDIPVLILALTSGLLVLEQIAPAARYPGAGADGIVSRIGRMTKNVALAGVNGAVVRGVSVLLALAAERIQFGTRPAALTDSLGLVFDFAVLDLWIYAWHRVVHASRFTWRFHQVHHSESFLDLTTSVRFHAGDVLLSTLSRGAVILAFEIPLYDVFLFEMATVGASLFHHSNVRLPRTLDRILSIAIVTPSFHRVHHHPERAMHDSNYATLFSLWDRIFGSRLDHIDVDPVTPGLAGRPDAGFWDLVAMPFRPERDATTAHDERPSGHGEDVEART